jgi:hypothetical protein
MTRIARLCLLFSAVCLASPAWAASASMKLYSQLKQDDSLYLGEGEAELKDFDGSAAKALDAARQRAKGSLAESIQVHISSATQEHLGLDKGQASESISSTTQSQASLDVENIHYAELKDFPETGQITVLASVSKVDYQRQLAGKKAPVYQPQWSLSLGVMESRWGSLHDFSQASRDQRNAYVSTHSPTGQDWSNPDMLDGLLGYSLEVGWRGLILGFDYFQTDLKVWKVHFNSLNPAGAYFTSNYALTRMDGEVGYDWAPFAWRVQPFLPLRLKVSQTYLRSLQTQGLHQATLWGSSLGLGLRFWVNPELTLEVGASQDIPFGNATLDGDNWWDGPFKLSLSPDVNAPPFSLNAMNYIFRVRWSGF